MSVWTGYRSKWVYRGVWTEKKIRPGLWKFKFVATKSRQAKGYGSITRGDEIDWGFRGVNQRVRKIGKGRYQTVMEGLKYYKGGRFGK